MRVYKIIFEKDEERRFVLCEAKDSMKAAEKWNERADDIGKGLTLVDILLMEVITDEEEEN